MRAVTTLTLVAVALAGGCPGGADDDDGGRTIGDEAEGEGEGEDVAATAALDGEVVVWLAVDGAVRAVSHDVGATFSFQADASEAKPGIFGTVAFDEDGVPFPCRDQGLTSNLEVRFLQPGGFFGAPVFGSDEATCSIEVIARPRCPGETLSLRFSGFLFGLAAAEGEVMSVTAGELHAATDFMLHGETEPDGCP